MTQPMIYSYRRISSKKQELGKGMLIQREDEAIQRLSREFGLPVSKVLLDDVGRSAFHGLHVKKGRLGWFLEAVERGEVAEGSILVVQSFDRFSREDVSTATNQLTNITQKKVMIYSVMENLHLAHPQDSNQEQGFKLQMAVGIFMRAHSESQAKSFRSKKLMAEAIKQFKDGIRSPDDRVIAIKVVGNDVWWVDNSDGTIRKSPRYFDRAREILLKRIEGLSVYKILNWLNDKGSEDFIPSPTNRVDKKDGRHGLWTRDMVNRLCQPSKSKVHGSRVKARPVLGEKLIGDEVLEGYYPPLVTESEYNQLMRMIKERSRPKSRSKQGESLFSGINVFCAHCQNGVTRTMETGSILNYRCASPYCLNRWSKRGVELEKAILDACINKVWRPEKKNQESNRVKVVEGRLIVVRNELQELQRLLNGRSSPTFAAKIFELEDEKASLDLELEKAKIAQESMVISNTKHISERWAETTTKVLDFKNDLGRIKFRDLLHDSCQYIKIGRPLDSDRYRLSIVIKFIDGDWRHVLLGRREVLSISGSDMFTLDNDALDQLSAIESQFNFYKPTPEIDKWLEGEFSAFDKK